MKYKNNNKSCTCNQTLDPTVPRDPIPEEELMVPFYQARDLLERLYVEYINVINECFHQGGYQAKDTVQAEFLRLDLRKFGVRNVPQVIGSRA